MASIYTTPDKVSFEVRYSDGSGKRLEVRYEKAGENILVIDGLGHPGEIIVAKDDLKWMIEVLEDVQRLCVEAKEKEAKANA